MLSTLVLSNENQTCRRGEAPASTGGGGCHGFTRHLLNIFPDKGDGFEYLPYKNMFACREYSMAIGGCWVVDSYSNIYGFYVNTYYYPDKNSDFEITHPFSESARKVMPTLDVHEDEKGFYLGDSWVRCQVYSENSDVPLYEMTDENITMLLNEE